MQIINTPLHDMFFELVARATSSIKLCSPFVKLKTVQKLYEYKQEQCKVELITNINLMNFYKSSSDIAAMRLIQTNSDKIFNFQKLHAKFYIFDNQYSIISSANLTPSGLSRNFEYGVLVDEPAFVKQTSADFGRLCKDEATGQFKQKHSIQIESLLRNLPIQEKISLPKLDLDYDGVNDAVLIDSAKNIIHHLSGWRKALYLALNLIEHQRFTTQDFKTIMPILQAQYPQNKHVEAKIRQQLQELRDLGLIKFEGNGVYKKLWQ